jgi:hypothetical protein
MTWIDLSATYESIQLPFRCAEWPSSGWTSGLSIARSERLSARVTCGAGESSREQRVANEVVLRRAVPNRRRHLPRGFCLLSR